MSSLFGSTHTDRVRWAIFAARQFARASGSPEIRANHLLAGLIAEDQGQLQQLPGVPEEMRGRIVASSHRRFLPAETAMSLMRKIEAARGEALELPFETSVPMGAAVKRVSTEAARLAHAGRWRWLLGPQVDTKHYWRALLESELPEGAELRSCFPALRL